MKQTFWNPTKTVKPLHRKPGTKHVRFNILTNLSQLIVKR